jgi:hypothetical protein
VDLSCDTVIKADHQVMPSKIFFILFKIQCISNSLVFKLYFVLKKKIFKLKFETFLPKKEFCYYFYQNFKLEFFFFDLINNRIIYCIGLYCLDYKSTRIKGHSRHSHPIIIVYFRIWSFKIDFYYYLLLYIILPQKISRKMILLQKKAFSVTFYSELKHKKVFFVEEKSSFNLTFRWKYCFI